MPNADAESHYYQGIDHFSEGKLDEAIAEYQKALDLDPAFVDALHGLTRAYYEKGDYRQAIHYAKRIQEVDPDDVLAYTNLSIYYQKLGMLKEAEEEATRARLLAWKKQLK